MGVGRGGAGKRAWAKEGDGREGVGKRGGERGKMQENWVFVQTAQFAPRVSVHPCGSGIWGVDSNARRQGRRTL